MKAIAHKTMMKKISAFLAGLMVYQSMALPLAEAQIISAPQPPQSGARLTASAPSGTIAAISNDSSKRFALPSTVGEIVEVYAPSRAAGRAVYHVQDVHDLLDAQVNLSDIILRLESYAASQGKALLVGVEGAWGEIETDTISAYPDQARKEAVAAGFLRAGNILGDEYAAAVSEPGRIKLVGVETPALYMDNWAAEARSTASRERVLAVVREIRRQLATLRDHNFNRPLVQLEENREALDKGAISLADHLGYLARISPAVLASHPKVARVLHVAELESDLDFGRIERETERLVDEVVGRSSDDEIESIVADAKALKRGALSPLTYYSRLLARTKAPYPALRSYVAYLASADAVKADELIDEIERAETAVARSLIQHPIAFDLYKHARWVAQQERFFDLTLIPQEWARQRGTDLAAIFERHRAIQNFVREQVDALGYDFAVPGFSRNDLASAVSASTRFYDAASSRDGALAENLADLLDTHPRDRYVVALVAGGFHTPGLVSRLNAAGHAVTVIRPHLETEIELDKSLGYYSLRPYVEGKILDAYAANTRRPLAGFFSGFRVPFLGALRGNTALETSPATPAVLNATTEPSSADKKRDGGTTLYAFPVGLLLFLNGGFSLGDAIAGIGALALLIAAGYATVHAVRTWRAKRLTASQKRDTESSKRVFDLARAGRLDHNSYVWVQSLGAALGSKVRFVPGGDRPFTWTREGFNVRLDAIEIGSSANAADLFAGAFAMVDGLDVEHALDAAPKAQALLSGAGLDLDVGEFLDFYYFQNEARDAQIEGVSPSALHDSQLARAYGVRFAERLGDAAVRARFTRAAAAGDLGERFARDVADKSAELDAYLSLKVAELIAAANDAAESTAFREAAKADLEMIVKFVSSAPVDELDSEAVEEARLPRQEDLLSAPAFAGDPAKHDVDPETGKPGPASEPYSALRDLPNAPTRRQVRRAVQRQLLSVDRDVYAGRLAHRYFAGGKARRLGVTVPAALVTPALVAGQAGVSADQQSELDDVPVIGRYILQVIASVIEIADRNGLDRAAGLANQRFVIAVSDDTEEEILSYFANEARFFGLGEHQFIFVRQKSGPGLTFDLDNGAYEVEETGNVESGPYGHGDLEFKHGLPNEGFIVRRDGDAIVKTVLPAPIHQLFAADNRVYSHHQISLLDGLRPGWVHDRERLAIGFAAVELGFAGSTEFREDDTGTKGGMTGLVRRSIDALTQFFGKDKGLFTIEGNQVATPNGANVKAKLQGYTANASVVLVSASAMADVIFVENFPVPFAVRSPGKLEGAAQVTIHPDTWSYWYYNLLPFLAFIPVNKREELKQQSHFALFDSYVRNQDDERTNSAYVDLARQIQADGGIQFDAVRPLAPFTPRVSLGLGLLGLAAAVVAFAFTGVDLGSTVSLASLAALSVPTLLGTIGLATEAADDVRLDRPVTVKEAKGDPRFDQRSVRLVRAIADGLRLVVENVGFDTRISGEGARNQILLGTGLVSATSRVPRPVRSIYAIGVIAHELVHAVVPQADNDSRVGSFINEAIAYPLGILFIPIVLVAIPFGRLFPSADVDTSYVGELALTTAQSRYTKTRRFYSRLRSWMRPYREGQTAGASLVLGHADSMIAYERDAEERERFANGEPVDVEQIEAHALQRFVQSIESVDRELHEKGGTQRDQSVVVYYVDDPELHRRLVSRFENTGPAELGYRIEFRLSDTGSTWRENVGALATELGGRFGDNVYFLGVGNDRVEGAEVIPTFSFAHQALARYAATHYSAAASALEMLLQVFERTFGRSINDRISHELMLQALVDLMA